MTVTVTHQSSYPSAGSGREQARSSTEVRPRELRPGWGTGRRTRPRSRPAGPVAAPRLNPVMAPGARGCQVERPAVRSVALSVPTLTTATWKLTDRAVALVLAAVLAIAAAAVVVVSLTALRVTGDTYLPAGQLSQQR